MTAEIELKLAIDPGAAPAVAASVFRHPAVAAAKRGRVREARVISTYFDTPDWRLAGAGIALRLRRDGTRWLQTVKGPPLADAGGALQVRGEYEWPIAGPHLDPARLATTPWRRRLGHALASAQLAPRFTTDFVRRRLALVFADGTRAQLCVDIGSIRASRRPPAGGRPQVVRAPIAEIEIELEAGNTTCLFRLARALATDLPLAVTTASKAARGQALVQGQPDGWHRPVRAQAVARAADAHAAEALRIIALECLHQIAANAPGLLHDDDPEWVHQMRVGTRRLRSCLALATPFVPPERLLPSIVEIKWLAGTLGHARDWDVFATETVPAAATGVASDPASAGSFRRLRARVATRRKAARAAARAVVRAPRFQHLLLAVGELCALPHFGVPASAKAGADDAPTLRATAFARRLLRRRQRKLVRRAEARVAGDPEQRHALRIAAKKLRYAAEFFAPLLDGERARVYIGALAGLQDVLGHANDAVTAGRLAQEVAGDGIDAAAAALQQHVAATTAAIEPELTRAWKRFAAAKRFWRKT